MQALCRRKNKMITLEDVRNAKLADLFCATIVKELTWEEAERYPLSVEGLPEGVTASDVLQYAVKSTLEERGEMSEKAFDDQCTGANPRYPLISEIKDMYLRAYYGK